MTLYGGREGLRITKQRRLYTGRFGCVIVLVLVVVLDLSLPSTRTTHAGFRQEWAGSLRPPRPSADNHAPETDRSTWCGQCPVVAGSWPANREREPGPRPRCSRSHRSRRGRTPV